MGDLFGMDVDTPYDERKRRLLAAGVALWDVCGAAVRPGSLDASINRRSTAVNEFGSFLSVHTEVTLICFNGIVAEQLYRSRVVPTLPAKLGGIRSTTLPSTSPANAGMPYVVKVSRWFVVRTECET